MSVNGRSLTKGEVATKLAKTYQNALRQPGGNANLAGQTVLEERGRIVDAFVDRRLVADAAMHQNLLSKDFLSAYVSSNMTFRAKAQNISLSDYEAREPRMARYLRAMFEEDALIAAFIATNLAPKVAVTPEVVSNYMAEVDAENALVAQTNAALRARLETIRRESLADPNRWEGLAAGASVDDDRGRSDKCLWRSIRTRHADVFADLRRKRTAFPQMVLRGDRKRVTPPDHGTAAEGGCRRPADEWAQSD